MWETFLVFWTGETFLQWNFLPFDYLLFLFQSTSYEWNRQSRCLCSISLLPCKFTIIFPVRGSWNKAMTQNPKKYENGKRVLTHPFWTLQRMSLFSTKNCGPFPTFKNASFCNMDQFENFNRWRFLFILEKDCVCCG